MPAVTWTVHGDATLRVQFNAARNKMTDWTPQLRASKDKYLRTVEEAFRFEHSASGSYWRPLASRTQQERAAGGFPPAHPILVRTGDLKWSATHASGAGNGISGYHIVGRHKLKMSLYGDKVQHQDGYRWKPPTGKEVNVPARPFWDFEDWQQTEMFKPFEQWADQWLFYP